MIISDLSTPLWFNRLPEDLLWQSISSPLSEHYREEMECPFVICINNQHPKLKYVRPVMLCTSDGLPSREFPLNQVELCTKGNKKEKPGIVEKVKTVKVESRKSKEM